MRAARTALLPTVFAGRIKSRVRFDKIFPTTYLKD